MKENEVLLFNSQQEEVLLKKPYESNCKDYDEHWEKNNRTGPRSKQVNLY